jgi:hypothetical protein
MLGAVLFMPVGLFLRAKTDERTLTVSPEGISTEIGSLKGQIPWRKVDAVTDTGPHVLVVGTTGNAFFIPNRAFREPGQKAEFLALIERWR